MFTRRKCLLSVPRKTKGSFGKQLLLRRPGSGDSAGAGLATAVVQATREPGAGAHSTLSCCFYPTSTGQILEGGGRGHHLVLAFASDEFLPAFFLFPAHCCGSSAGPMMMCGWATSRGMWRGKARESCNVPLERPSGGLQQRGRTSSTVCPS